MKRAIVVEDDTKWRNRIAGILQNEGYTVITFNKYSDRVRFEVAQSNYDLLVVDLKLNHLELSKNEGFEIISLARHKNVGIPVILISGYIDFDGKLVEKALMDYKVHKVIFKSDWDAAAFIKVVNDTIATTEEFYKNQDSKSLGKQNITIINFQGNQYIGDVGFTIDKSNYICSLDELEERLSEKMNATIRSYSNDLKSDVEMILSYVRDDVLTLKDITQSIFDVFNRLKDHDETIKRYFEEWRENSKISDNKLELAISLIPGILKFKKNIDLDKCLKNLAQSYDKATFAIYERLATFYYELKEKARAV
ncbi:MAG: response regulator [Desulfobacterales bacterium]|nr:response regulator [Desulfobacterales bacterium]